MLNNIKAMLVKAMDEWSVGDLSNKIDKNITDKVSLKSLKKGDIIVLAKTSIYDMAKSRDKGDIQVTITDISGTDVKGTAVNGENVDLNLLDMRILEAYSMLDSDIKIFVIDLPTKLNKTFEALESKTLETFESKIENILSDIDKFNQDGLGLSKQVLTDLTQLNKDLDSQLSVFITGLKGLTKYKKGYYQNYLNDENPKLNQGIYYKDTQSIENSLKSVLKLIGDLKKLSLSESDDPRDYVSIPKLIESFNSYQDFFKKMADKGIDVFLFDKFQNEIKEIKSKSNELLVLLDKVPTDKKELKFLKMTTRIKLLDLDKDIEKDKKSNDAFFTATTCEGVSYDLSRLVLELGKL